jgi:hypothetical protein
MATQTAKVNPIRSQTFLAAHQEEIVDLAFDYWRDRIGLREGSHWQGLLMAVGEVCKRHARSSGLFLVPKL